MSLTSGLCSPGARCEHMPVQLVPHLQDLFRSTLRPLNQVLDDSDMKKHEIVEIVLVGGSTRIPKVQQLVKEFFNGKVSLRVVDLE